MTEQPQETDATRELVLTRIIDAPRDKVWRCLTEPELIERWFCPKPWVATDVVIDLRPGGETSSVMRGPEGEVVPNMGVFLDIVPRERLVTTDAFLPGWIPSGHAFMTAEITLQDAEGGKTRYTARARHWTEEARAQHETMGFHQGWGKAAEQLEEVARGL